MSKTIKISPETVNILKSLSQINPSINIQPGGVISTISDRKNILASVPVTEQFPVEFAIYDLLDFLNVVSLFDDPSFTFDEKQVTIEKQASGNSGMEASTYVFTNKVNITVPPEKQLKMPSKEIEFSLPVDTLKRLVRAANVTSLPDLSLTLKDSKVVFLLTDRANDSSNTFTIELEAKVAGSQDFSFNFKTKNLKLLEDDYVVEVSKKNISRFEGKNNKAVYFIALEPSSYWNE